MAVGIALFKPFAPKISVQSLVAVPVAVPFSNFPDRFRQFRLTVRNDGRLPIWLSPSDVPIPDDSWSNAKGGPTRVEIGIYKDSCTKLAAGESRVYDLVVHAEYEQFRLWVHARDWRGRDGYTYLGIHKPTSKNDNEISVGVELGVQGFTSGQSALPARGTVYFPHSELT